MENDIPLSPQQEADIRRHSEANGDRYIPDGHGNMINERFQQIIEHIENNFFETNGRDPSDEDYSVIESQASDLFEDGFKPEPITPEQEINIQKAREEVARQHRYNTIEKSHGPEWAFHAERLDKEIDDSMIPANNATGVRPYKIETKSTRAPGMPGGRTWSIKQVFGR